MFSTDFPAFDGDPDDYKGDEVLEHTWPDGRVDILPVYCQSEELPSDRIEGPSIARAVLLNMLGTMGMGGAGMIGSHLFRMAPDLYALVDEDETYPEEAPPATIARGSTTDVVDAWLSSLPVNEFTPDLAWQDVAMANPQGLAELADPVLFEGSLPVCLFPSVEVAEETAEWFVDLVLDLKERERSTLRQRWSRDHPWATRVADRVQPERSEFERQ